MSIKKIKKIAQGSFSGNILDKKLIDLVSSKLNRKELKTYIRELRIIQRKKVVKVFVPSRKILTDDMRRSLTNFFNKDLDIIEEADLIAGLRIVDDDRVYELNLKDSLENIVSYIQKTYD